MFSQIVRTRWTFLTVQLTKVQEIRQPKDDFCGCFVRKDILYRDKIQWVACMTSCWGLLSVRVSGGTAAAGWEAQGWSPEVLTLCRTKGLRTPGPARAVDTQRQQEPKTHGISHPWTARVEKPRGSFGFGVSSKAADQAAILLFSYWANINHLRKPGVPLSVGCVATERLLGCSECVHPSGSWMVRQGNFLNTSVYPRASILWMQYLFNPGKATSLVSHSIFEVVTYKSWRIFHYFCVTVRI